MGAESFVLEASAENADVAYINLVRSAREEYGYDSYNGTISTTDCYHLVGSENHSPCTKTSVRKAYDRVRKDGGGRKWTASCIDCGVEKYILRQVSRKATHKEPPKYETCYDTVVIDGEYLTPTVIRSFATKKEADDFTKKYLLNNPGAGCTASVKKSRRLVSGTDTVTDFSVEEKVYKSRPHPKSMEGRTLREIHKYVFYGYGSC